MPVEREAVSDENESATLERGAELESGRLREQRAPASAKAKRILVVDDEAPLLRLLRGILIASGYEVLTAAGGLQALELARRYQPDLMLLDLCMPGVDGLAVCQELRQWSEMPIIVLSALGEEHYKVHALDLGADDYLTKPFGYDELLARVRVCLRRSGGAQKLALAKGQTLFTSGDGHLKLEVVSHVVTVGGREIRLSPKEFELLYQLMRAADRVLTHHTLLKLVWGPEYGEEMEYLRVYMRQLRRKVERDPDHPRYLVTEPGVGYFFRSFERRSASSRKGGKRE